LESSTEALHIFAAITVSFLSSKNRARTFSSGSGLARITSIPIAFAQALRNWLMVAINTFFETDNTRKSDFTKTSRLALSIFTITIFAFDSDRVG